MSFSPNPATISVSGGSKVILGSVGSEPLNWTVNRVVISTPAGGGDVDSGRWDFIYDALSNGQTSATLTYSGGDPNVIAGDVLKITAHCGSKYPQLTVNIV